MSAELRLSELVSGVATRVVVDGVPVAVVRLDDAVYAIDDVCSHANVSLADGEVWPDACTLECPRHGSAFNLVTGQPDTLPATVPVTVHRVAIDGDVVTIEVNR